MDEHVIDATAAIDNDEITLNIRKTDGVMWLGLKDDSSSALWNFSPSGGEPPDGTTSWRLDSDNNCPYIFIGPVGPGDNGTFPDGTTGMLKFRPLSECD